MLAGIALLLLLGRALDALTSARTPLASASMSAERACWWWPARALIVGAATAVTGIMGFVGLIVPMRCAARRGDPASASGQHAGRRHHAAAGRCGLRLVQPWMDLRIGVLTALLGAPFFVWLVLKMRSELAP